MAAILGMISARGSRRLQNSSFRTFSEGWSAISVILECEAREPHSPSQFLHSLQTFCSNMDVPSLAFEKNTTVLQSKVPALSAVAGKLVPALTLLSGSSPPEKTLWASVEERESGLQCMLLLENSRGARTSVRLGYFGISLLTITTDWRH